jgi:hypothetical protein
MKGDVRLVPRDRAIKKHLDVNAVFLVYVDRIRRRDDWGGQEGSRWASRVTLRWPPVT